MTIQESMPAVRPQTIPQPRQAPASAPGSTAEVVIVDDHRLLMEALALALAGHGVQATLAPLGTLEAIGEHVIAAAPDLVLLDLDLGQSGDGSLLVRSLVEAGLRVLIVTAGQDRAQMARALEQGAIGVVRKDGSFDDLAQMVLAAVLGMEVMRPADRLHLIEDAHRREEARLAALAPFGKLTPREAVVLRQLARGHTVAVIAKQSVVSVATVRTQVQCILTKLGVGSQLEAVAAAHRCGWV